jgi:NitT/TauT family transport system substrate-binding protein
VAAFVKASMQGWKAYMTNPAQGNGAIKKANPAMTDEQLKFAMTQMNKYELVTGGDAKTQGLGIITEARLKKSYDMLVSNQLIDAAKVPLNETYTLQFIKSLNIK